MNYKKDCEFKKFPLTLFGYQKKAVDEYISARSTCYRKLKEENNDLREAIAHFKSEKSFLSDRFNWNDAEQFYLIGKKLQSDIPDVTGHVVAANGTEVTKELIEKMISKGLYGEMIAAIGNEKSD